MASATTGKPRGIQARLFKDPAGIAQDGLPVLKLGGEEDHEYLVFTRPHPSDPVYGKGSILSLRMTLPSKFPFKSPSIAFVPSILHPNVDKKTGAICLDTISKGWSPAQRLRQVFGTVLPIFLQDDNPSDPFNEEIAKVKMKSVDEYHRRAKEFAMSRIARFDPSGSIEDTRMSLAELLTSLRAVQGTMGVSEDEVAIKDVHISGEIDLSGPCDTKSTERLRELLMEEPCTNKFEVINPAALSGRRPARVDDRDHDRERGHDHRGADGGSRSASESRSKEERAGSSDDSAADDSGASASASAGLDKRGETTSSRSKRSRRS